MNFAPFGPSGFDRLDDRILIRHIARDEDAIIGSELLDDSIGPLGLLRDVEDNTLSALVANGTDRRLSKAASSARDDKDVALHPHLSLAKKRGFVDYPGLPGTPGVRTEPSVITFAIQLNAPLARRMRLA
jgi:hypothetical protein